MNEVEMLEAILLATQNSSLVWEQSDPGQYRGKGPMEVMITELSPLFAGDTETLGVQALQLEVNGLILTYWSGTSGCEKIRQIIYAGIPHCAHHGDVTAERIRQVIDLFKKT